MQKTALATLVLAALTVVPATLPAQDAVDRSVIEMVSLRYAQAGEVQEIVVRILGQQDVRIAADAKTNSVLIHADSQAKVDRVLALIRTLDVRTEGSAVGVTTAILKAKFRTAKEVLEVVQLYLSPQGRVAVNERTNSVVVKDEASRVQQMQEVIESLDVDPSAVHLDCWVLSPSADGKLDGALAPLGDELRRQGLGSYSAFSHSSVRALEGHTFTMAQQFTRRQLRSIEMQGTIRLGQPSSLAILELATTLQVGLPSERPQDDADTRLTVTTTLKAQIDEFVVLGLAPTGNENSKPLVLVVRIRR